MFVIKYHKSKCKTKYFSNSKGLVSTKESATAFGESFRKEALTKIHECTNMFIVPIKVSELAELIYADKVIKVKEIRW